MKKFENYLAYILLGLIIGFNLWLNFPETKILADPNDNIFQYSLVYRTNWVWEHYGCPLSLSCLPNLVDHVVTAWAEGYPLPLYYSHIPQIAIVSSYHLIVKPFISIFQYPFSLYQYYNWTKYLLLTLFPLPVFLALRLVGFSPLISLFGAFFASHFSTDGLYGIDPPSYLWRGYGLTSQLYALFFLPLGLAFTYKALQNTLILKNYAFWAAVFLTLATAGHLGIGIIGILSTFPFLFLDLNKTNILKRAKILFYVLCSVFLVLSYWLIPLLLNNSYHIISFWDPLWKFNSYGWYEVARQFFQGEIFDWQRAPVITTLVAVGFFALLSRGRLFAFSLLFTLWFLLYFGRTTWGGLIDLIPGMKDFHQHRFIVGVHVAALFLIPAGIEYILNVLRKILNIALAAFSLITNPIRQLTDEHLMGTRSGRFTLSEAEGTRKLRYAHAITFYILSFIFISFLAYYTGKQMYDYAQLNNRWIGEANRAYLYDEKNFQELAAYLKTLPPARIYAGRPGNWGKDFRLGSSQMYMLFGIHGFDISQFLPETWSPLSENEQNFDERVGEDFDLLNIRYLVVPKDKQIEFTKNAKLVETFGPFQLFKVPTTGWFDVVTSPMLVKTNKTNYINLVHFWHRSYPRRWKMHPLISVEKNPKIPFEVQKIIEMKDEVSYIEGAKELKNIFSDYPFVFPEATVSAKMIKEKVDKQIYSAEVEVPENCKSCLVMLKMSYHPDWQVTLDGKPAEKYAVFPFYLATYVSSGTHKVEFSYHPNRLKVVLIWVELIIGVSFLFLLIKKYKRSNSRE